MRAVDFIPWGALAPKPDDVDEEIDWEARGRLHKAQMDAVMAKANSAFANAHRFSQMGMMP